jgi:hypothetical protein
MLICDYMKKNDLVFLLSTLTLCLFIFYIITHENAHKNINDKFNLNSTIEYNLLELKGTTIVNIQTDDDSLNYEKAIPYHLYNELIGQIIQFFILLFISFWVVYYCYNTKTE